MPSPSLSVRRIVVEGYLQLDLCLEKGLNVVEAIPAVGDQRSTNRCGKTALVELIQHGLGRRQHSRAKFHFEPIMDQLETLWLEVETNGEVFTIERSLKSISAAAYIRDGEYFSGMKGFPGEPISVPDISTLLLNRLGIPKESVKTAEGNLDPLTFPTLMRAFILHQEDSFGAILDKMIPEQRRTDVIGFLSGIIPVGRFAVEERLAETQTRAQNLESYYTSVKSFLANNGVASPSEADSNLRQVEQELCETKEAQRALQVEIRDSSRAQPAHDTGRVDALTNKLLSLKAEVADVKHMLTRLRQEEERLREVLASLKVDQHKTRRLQTSSSILNSVEFGICPRCLQEVTSEMKQREQLARCYLCNRPISTNSDSVPRKLPNTHDLDAQIAEAHEVLGNVVEEIKSAETLLTTLEVNHSQIANLLELEMNVYVAPAVDSLLLVAGDIATHEAKLAEARRLHEQAQALDAVREELKVLRNEQDMLNDQLREARQPRKGRIAEFRDIYESILIEVGFPGFRSCSIDNNTLMPSINGSGYVHQGLALKGLAVVCYHLAIFHLAQIEDTLFPRMLVIDSPAVGDLNEENHEKLLHYLAQLGTQHDSSDLQNWQIILTTRKSIPELDPWIKMTISSADGQMLLRRPAT